MSDAELPERGAGGEGEPLGTTILLEFALSCDAEGNKSTSPYNTGLRSEQQHLDADGQSQSANAKRGTRPIQDIAIVALHVSGRLSFPG